MAERNQYVQPMDFEFDNKHGAVDPSSPFIANFRNGGSFASSQGDLGADWRLQAEIDQRKSNTQKRAFAQYESPQKADTPSLRPPGAGQTVLFSQAPDTNKRLPPKPRDPLWTTPRTSRVVDFSSGGETPDTENWKADSEATPDTPSMGMKKVTSVFSKMLGSGKKSSSKGKELVSKGSPSSGRGEIAKPYSQKVASRVIKKREKEQAKRRKLLRDVADSETEADTEVEGSTRRQPASTGFDIGGFFHYLESHPNLPNVLSFYAQLALNIFLVFGIMYLLYSFWSTIRSDVDKKSQEAMAEVLAEIAVCAKHWKDNQCDRGSVLPALEAVCREWEKCMNKDHKSIGRARVSAHTFAEIFNSFIEPISWKAMVRTSQRPLRGAGSLTISSGIHPRHCHPNLRRHQRRLQLVPTKCCAQSLSEYATRTTNATKTSELGDEPSVRLHAVWLVYLAATPAVGPASWTGASAQSRQPE